MPDLLHARKGHGRGGGGPIDEVIRVLVADDHAASRTGVRLALHGRGFQVVAEAATGPGAVEAAYEHRPDVCLLDINMPGDGIAAARQIAGAVPETRIVMLTVSEDQNDLFEALRAGASGYLLKDTPSTRLAAALRGVLEGEAALPRVLVARLIAAFRGSPAADPSRGVLTEREWEVLRLMQKRLSTAEIAQSLAIAPVTVRTHVAAILRKLRVSDRESAVRSLDPR